MYITTGTIMGITIALGASLFLLIVLTYANIKLVEQNRFLKQRLQAWRQACRSHVEVPF